MTEGMTKPITRILVVVLAKRVSSTCISSQASLNQNLQSDPSIPNLLCGDGLSRRPAFQWDTLKQVEPPLGRSGMNS